MSQNHTFAILGPTLSCFNVTRLCIVRLGHAIHLAFLHLNLARLDLDHHHTLRPVSRFPEFPPLFPPSPTRVPWSYNPN